MSKIKIIAAGAGSGKTYRLTNEMFDLLGQGVRPSGIIATTFTAKAATELQERVRTKLLEHGMTNAANDLANALIGTVHGLGVKLLRRFAFEAGVSPKVDIIAEGDQAALFNNSLAQILTPERTERMDELSQQLGLLKSKMQPTDWRKVVQDIADAARANNFDAATLEKSKRLSFQSFEQLLVIAPANSPDGIALPSPPEGGELPNRTSQESKTIEPSRYGQSSPPSGGLGGAIPSGEFAGAITPGVTTLDEKTYLAQLRQSIETTIEALEQSPDETKVTKDGTNDLRHIRNELRQSSRLAWYQFAKIQKTKVGKKSEPLLEALRDVAAKHIHLTAFRNDIQAFIDGVFDLAQIAIEEFDQYKRQRGLIDYTDMEVYINRLLNNPAVVSVLREELDLLLVDEFQDTSPIQLELFLKLSKIAKQSIWVGDPKQSIYGFRGAEPRLMQAIIEKVGIRSEDILSDSWRSRPDLVYASNAIFTKAFDHIPSEQVALNPKVTDTVGQTDALIHWRMLEAEQPDKVPTSGAWLDDCIAQSIRTMLARQTLRIKRKGETMPSETAPPSPPEGGELKVTRLDSPPSGGAVSAGKTVAIIPKDIAILCRSNKACVSMAAALQKVGIKAAIAQTGLLRTAEVALTVAALRYLLNRQDALAVAEMRLLANAESLSSIIEDRLDFVGAFSEDTYPDWQWAADAPFVQRINELRRETGELSSTEILNLLLDQLDIRRIIAAWGNAPKRLENLDKLRYFALQYENRCNRFHSAASLGGFLLYLQKIAADDKDQQSSGEGPNAVHILTYHRSKGLEYPIVVCHGLGQNMRDDVFGLQMMSERETVELDDILGGRWLRYWVNPYADQLKNTALDTNIAQSAAKTIAHRLALEEEARLLYVGITRARDYLIFATTRKTESAKWLNRTFHQGKEDEITLLEGNDTRFEWQGKLLQQQYEEFFYPKNTPFAAPTADAPSYFIAPAKGAVEHTPYRIDSEREGFQPPMQVVIQDEYAAPMLRAETTDALALTRAVHAFWAADRHIYPAVTRHAMATALLQRMDLAHQVTTMDLLAQRDAWRRWLVQQFGAAHTVEMRYPVRWHTARGRLFDATLDAVVEYAEGFALVQHHYFAGEVRKCRTEAMRQATILGYARTAFLAQYPTTAVTCYVHFPILGVVVLME